MTPEQTALPVLVVHGYVERPDIYDPTKADYSSKLVGEAAAELIATNCVRGVLLTTNWSGDPKISVAQKIADQITDSLSRKGVDTSPVHIEVMPVAESTIEEVGVARRSIRKGVPVTFLGIADHTHRIEKVVERAYHDQDAQTSVVSAETVLHKAATQENDYETLLHLEAQDPGRATFNRREKIYNFIHDLPFGGVIMTALQPLQKTIAPWLYRHIMLEPAHTTQGTYQQHAA